MFDDNTIENFKYYKEYEKLIAKKVSELYDEFTEAELIHKVKCCLAILEKKKPTMTSYYIQAYINDVVDIYTRWAKGISTTTFEYLVLTDKLIVNKGTLMEFTLDNVTTRGTEQAITLLSDSFRTIIGYTNPYSAPSESNLVIR